MDRLGLVCRSIYENPNITQRELSNILGLSLGTINSLVRESITKQLITQNENGLGSYRILPNGTDFLKQFKVDGAVILAAGFGSRFVPLTFELPKGLLDVFGERMIERQIKQLHEVGIYNITVVVGYLKEKFEYLIDKYNVNLLYNPEYSTKNTLTTVYHASHILGGKNMYLLSSDNWIRQNMFHAYECGAWYSAAYTDGNTSEWCLNYNKKGLITDIYIGGHKTCFMYGPAFFSSDFSRQLLPILEAYYHLPGTEQFYWEQVYQEILNGDVLRRIKELDDPEIIKTISESITNSPPNMYINRQPDDQVYEFENLEELRQFDARYQTHSDNKALELVSSVLNIEESEILDIRCLKAGMTNKSFLFKVQGKHYICRIPGPGTELLINRNQEQEVYSAVNFLNLTEHIIYFSGESGYKIAEYYEGARNSNARDWNDVSQCMHTLHKLHDAALQVNHSFHIRERITFYETLCKSHGSILFEDYDEVLGWMTDLMDRLDSLNRTKVLSHIDSVSDNFLFLPDGQIRLIDWEYAGMCDPLIDISMCAIYSNYNEEETDRLIELYFGREADEEERLVIYSYIALGGFLWSLWAVYKSALGEEFGEYTLIMYRYAKQYYRKILKKL